MVYEAYKKVKANQGAAGVDEETIEEFEEKLGRNLYKIWNRLSSGSYYPPPVKGVLIPKKSGGIRTLGIPTISDRVAQMVVKMPLTDGLPIGCVAYDSCAMQMMQLFIVKAKAKQNLS